MKVFCVDIDGTLFNEKEVYDSPKTVNEPVVKMVNHLHRRGNFIRIYTSRGSATGLDWTEPTYRQLVANGIPFHEIVKKPWADYYVDDKNLSISQFTNGDFML